MPYTSESIERLAQREVPQMLARWLGEDNGISALQIRRNDFLNDGPDLFLEAGGLTFLVEIKKGTGIADVALAIEQVRRYTESWQQAAPADKKDSVVPLVVVPFMSDAARKRCAEERISWLDLSGNAGIQVHSDKLHVHVWVEGKPNKFTSRGRYKNLFAPKAARLTRHLLLHPDHAFSQRELAQAVDLDEGYTSKLVRQMEDKDLLIRTDDGAIQVRDYNLLLDAWANANEYRHEVIAGHIPARTGEDLARRLNTIFEKMEIKYALTGLAAAWAYTHAAAFRSVTCYVEGSIPMSELEQTGFRHDTGAPNVRLLIPDDRGVFHEDRQVEGMCIVSPVQAYVDLQQEPERAAEFAEALHNQLLKTFDVGAGANG